IGWSGGSEPGEEINPAAVEAMAEIGIDITGEYPKPWTEEILKAADVIITMGCGDACPVYPGRRCAGWGVLERAGLDVADIRPIRAEIETRVRALLAERDVPTACKALAVTDKPSVLFVCVHNAGRSQMAAGFLAHLAGGAIEVR